MMIEFKTDELYVILGMTTILLSLLPEEEGKEFRELAEKIQKQIELIEDSCYN